MTRVEGEDAEHEGSEHAAQPPGQITNEQDADGCAGDQQQWGNGAERVKGNNTRSLVTKRRIAVDDAGQHPPLRSGIRPAPSGEASSFGDNCSVVVANERRTNAYRTSHRPKAKALSPQTNRQRINFARLARRGRKYYSLKCERDVKITAHMSYV